MQFLVTVIMIGGNTLSCVWAFTSFLFCWRRLCCFGTFPCKYFWLHHLLHILYGVIHRCLLYIILVCQKKVIYEKKISQNFYLYKQNKLYSFTYVAFSLQFSLLTNFTYITLFLQFSLLTKFSLKFIKISKVSK